jgi:hypothetical protein
MTEEALVFFLAGGSCDAVRTEPCAARSAEDENAAVGRDGGRAPAETGENWDPGKSSDMDRGEKQVLTLALLLNPV